MAARTHLPPGIYVDPYELASLQQQNLTKVTTPNLRHLEGTQIRMSMLRKLGSLVITWVVEPR